MLSHTLGQKSVIADTSGQKSVVTRKSLAERTGMRLRRCLSRLAELREGGEPESEYDAWLRDRFYPIVTCVTVPDKCGLKPRVVLKDDEVRE